ncbi:BPI fold-containing family C protein-like isoform X2 [Engystomops pustulosus]|uniref:BPI fold-containing family C protein-like isoform X2 n=1 Tax=Engystomops pustulosus TaxID=76066 RepID=UPI003AFA2BF3
MMWSPVITFLLLTLSTICYGENPGAKILVKEQGLKKGVEYLVNKLMSNNTEYQLPDVSGSENIASEDMNYEFTQIRLVKFHHGNILSDWVPETGMHVSMENGSATINCNWKIDSWLIDSGRGILTISGLSISMMMGLRRIDPGVPSISLLDCQSSIHNVDIQMLDGVSYVYESLKQPLQDVVRATVNRQLCSAIRSQSTKWDESVSHLQLNVTLNPFIDLDVSLVGNPEITDSYGCLGLKGLFRTHNESHSEAAFSPAPLNISIQDGAMIYIGVSQSSLASLASAYYSAEFLTFQVSHMEGSKALTTAELATYIPEISQHFPNSLPVKILMYATRTPMVFLHSKNITVQFGGSLQANAYSSEAKHESIFSANIVASFQVNMSMSEAIGARGMNLTASMNLNRLQIEGSQPKENKVAVTEKAVQQLIHGLIIPSINENLSRGIFISSSFLKNATVYPEEGFATLAANIQ